MKIYEKIFDSWENALKERWLQNNKGLRDKDSISLCAWIVVGGVLIITLVGLCASVILRSKILVSLFFLFMIIDALAYLLIRFFWDRPLQKEISIYKEGLNQEIFETLTQEQRISANAWKLILDCVLADCERLANRRKNVAQSALTLVTSICVGIVASDLWESAQGYSSDLGAIIAVLFMLFMLVLFACGIMWMAADTYEKLVSFGKIKRVDLERFAKFVEYGLFRLEIEPNTNSRVSN